MSQVWARDPYQPRTWPRLFTLHEANDLLPDVMPLLLEVRSRKVTLDSALCLPLSRRPCARMATRLRRENWKLASRR